MKRVFERHPRTAPAKTPRTPKGCRKLAPANFCAEAVDPKPTGSQPVGSFIADGNLSAPEFDRIKELAKRFDITDADWKTLYASTASERIAASVNQFLDDGLLSDEEWGRTEALAKDLRVNLAFHADSKADIEYARDRWRAQR